MAEVRVVMAELFIAAIMQRSSVNENSKLH